MNSGYINHNNYLRRDTSISIELGHAWQKFANAVLSNDLKAIKSLSTNCIRIDYAFCVTDTARRDSLSDGTEFVPIDVFLSQSLKIIFDQKIRIRLLDKSKINFLEGDKYQVLYAKKCIIGKNSKDIEMYNEVLITKIDSSKDCEGYQYAFVFILIKGEYKFCGFSTIP